MQVQPRTCADRPSKLACSCGSWLPELLSPHRHHTDSARHDFPVCCCEECHCAWGCMAWLPTLQEELAAVVTATWSTKAVQSSTCRATLTALHGTASSTSPPLQEAPTAREACHLAHAGCSAQHTLLCLCPPCAVLQPV